MNKVNQILSNISTTKKDNFPDNKNDIHTLIAEAEKSLTIVIDQPMYGALSNPELFEEFFQDIQQKISKENFTVKIIFPTSYYRNAMRRKQFNIDSNDINKKLDSLPLLRKINYRDKLKAYCKYINSREEFGTPINSNAIITYADFERVYEQKTEIFIQQLLNKGTRGERKSIQVDSAETAINANFWLADDKKLFFTLISYGKETKEFSYFSKDNGFLTLARESYENLLSTCKHPNKKQ